MSFGYGFGLPSWQTLSGGFNPSSLFVGGTQGVWYDPSDASTLFSDTAGTTPSPTPGGGALSVVGLMLDKSQGGVGANGAKRLNLLTWSQEFDNAAWTKDGLNAFGSGSVANTSATTDPLGGNTADYIQENTALSKHRAYQALGSSGVSYAFSCYLKAGQRTWAYLNFGDITNRQAWFDLANGVVGTVSAGLVASIQAAGNGWYRCTITRTASAVSPNFDVGIATADNVHTYTGDGTSGIYVWGADLRLASDASTAPTYQPITSSWYSTMAGNHAISYNTTTARPELSARVNLLLNSENFSGTGWTVDGMSLTASAGTAPNGSNTATSAALGTGNNRLLTFDNTGVLGNKVFSIYVKPNTGNTIDIQSNGGMTPAATAVVNASTGVVTGFTGASTTFVGDGWYRVILPVNVTTASGNSTYWQLRVTTGSVLIWGAQLISTNQFPANTYQRIADQYTYDSSGFPRYLVFNGTASGMYTPANLNLSGTAQATVFAGVRKISDAALGVVAEFSAGIATNNGSFLLSAPNSAAANYNFSSKGTTQVDNTVTTYTAPISNVVTGQGNISAPSNVIRVNGTQAGSVVTTQGTGNYGTFALNLGARNAQSGTPTVGTFLNGYIYSLIVVGAASTAAQISSTESWINGKEGTVY